jgi:PAS domain S-box-containing protein
MKQLFRQKRGDAREREGRDTNSFLNAIIDRAAEGLCVCHEIAEPPFIRFTVWNPRMTEITGYTMEEINRSGWHQTLYPDESESCRAAERMARMREGCDLESEEWEICRADGRRRTLSISTSVLETGDGVVHVLALMHDITERRQMEKALVAAEREKAAVLDAMSDIVTYQNRDAIIIWANRAAADYVGANREQMAGKHCHEVMCHSGGICSGCPIRAVADTHKVQEGEVADRENDRILYVLGYPVLDDGGELTGIVGVARDITEKRLKEEADFKARKLESIGILAGGIAHDFNNVLTAVLGNINLAQMSLEAGNRLPEHLEKAEAACLRAKDLSQKLITFAKGGEPMKQKGSLVALLQRVLKMRVTDPRIRCHLTHGEDLYEVAFDGSQMHQAFENIVANAVESMPGGGGLFVHIENVAVADALSALVANGRHLKITIRDEGKGIPERELEKIFDPYYTTKSMGTQKGMGLGLSITHSIITKHNGHIAVESAPGKGTVVCVYLPIERTAHEPLEIPTPSAAGPEKDRVLIMDDEKMVLDVAGEMLRRLGYEVERAQSGEEAIKRYASAIANGEPFDAVILDLTVREGMGGREAMEHLLRVDPQVVAFLSSGYSEDPAIKDHKRYGFTGVIKKPYSVDLLARSLAEGMGY